MNFLERLKAKNVVKDEQAFEAVLEVLKSDHELQNVAHEELNKVLTQEQRARYEWVMKKRDKK
jgi:hypothetical protein